MEFPLRLSFKILAISPQMAVTDARGELVLYVKQKVFKLKEAVTVFADAEQSRPLYRIDADRVIDLSAHYRISRPSGEPLGVLRGQGLRSLWRARYDVLHEGNTILGISEENVWSKVADQLLGGIPILGLLSGYLFHPAYRVTRPDGTLVLRARKEPAFWESRFTITKEANASTPEEALGVLGLLMMLLLERGRG
jgi:hypothetical protein